MEKTLSITEFRQFIKPQTNWIKELSSQLKNSISSLNFSKVEYIATELFRTAAVLEGLEESLNKESTNTKPLPEEPLFQSIGKKIALIAENSYGNNTISHGRCLWAVQNILDKANITTRRVPSAYMAATVFPQSQTFIKYYQNYNNTDANLDTLPPGTIIVFNKTVNHPHGHIEIKSTSGTSWISDYKQLRRVKYSGNKPMAIFIPKDNAA